MDPLRLRLPLYTVCHLLVDWACILLVTGPLRQAMATREAWLWLILAYNACAFASLCIRSAISWWTGPVSFW